VSASSTGSVLYRAASLGGGTQLTWFDRSGRVLARVGSADAGRTAEAISLSQDGRRVALTRRVDGNSDIWLLDLQRGGVMSRLTFDAAIDNFALWSRDGLRVAFASPRNGPLDIFQRRVGGEADEPLLTSSQNKVPAAWAPDGHVLLYLRADPKTHLDVWALPVGGDRTPFPVVRSPYEDLNPQFSPDGRWIAYQSDQSGRFEVYLQPFRGSAAPVLVSTEGGTQPRWRADGKELFYLDLARRLTAVPIAYSPNGQSADVGVPLPLFPSAVGGLGSGQRQYEVSPDGQRFLIDAPVERVLSPLVLIQHWTP
jgi:Tol biopolymer transport system component